MNPKTDNINGVTASGVPSTDFGGRAPVSVSQLSNPPAWAGHVQMSEGDGASQIDASHLAQRLRAEHSDPPSTVMTVDQASELAKATARLIRSSPDQASAAHVHTASTAAMLDVVNRASPSAAATAATKSPPIPAA